MPSSISQPLPLAFLLQQVEAIAREAGAAILDIYGEDDFGVEHKADESPLTRADLAANRVIVEGLSALVPTLPILTEEAVEDFTGPDDQGRYWLVDPLDGTKEFIKRNGEFTVNIALIEQGRPVLGVVLAPVLDTLWLAAEDLGAFRIDGEGERQAIKVSTHTPDAPWKVYGSRSHLGPHTLAWMEALGSYELIRMGSSIKLCLVAEGKGDLYPRLGPTCLWDTAAAHAVISAAGGQLLTPEGDELSYADTTETLNPHFIVYGGSKPE
ncbi:3'(2'),5'-bisphosphate nucleotidase CysQ [Marinobacterium sediminicola]|uniref:3'(2'),5'-bisphosphate nucleotidase CysQ n=1 Tax=Marinobacterium sediminicola TaxID=518898 RepID=A0ABY1S2A0_9GAMM|nr:3'(2'),5'-bisphosphate nucleotidase CysQ [Marinobacterium sediminicola]ULG68470.1 3'(2'),5'-bisphosphate nucleotidase CysQ [Marinobacterium sediminicola]SMR76766.1 3'(2'),5'-bisphosphate nucleotidase [Marinobacterium sediminicola]